MRSMTDEGRSHGLTTSLIRRGSRATFSRAAGEGFTRHHIPNDFFLHVSKTTRIAKRLTLNPAGLQAFTRSQFL
jgi:hypothetical protein